MKKRRMIGSLCVALIGLATPISEAPRLAHAQQLPPAQKVPQPAPLTGTLWLLAESAGHRISQDDRQPYFALKTMERYGDGSAGRVEDARDSCGNSFRGVYRTTGDWLHLRIISSTLLACKVTERMPRDLIATLTGHQQYRIHGSELDLLDNSGEVRTRFVAGTRK